MCVDMTATLRDILWLERERCAVSDCVTARWGLWREGLCEGTSRHVSVRDIRIGREAYRYPRCSSRPRPKQPLCTRSIPSQQPLLAMQRVATPVLIQKLWTPEGATSGSWVAGVVSTVDVLLEPLWSI